MKISKSARFESLFFLLIAALFISGEVKFEIRMFIIWGIVSLFFTAAIFLIHTFSKRETKNVYVPLFLLFAGCLAIYAGLFELRDKFLILVGGVFMAFGVLSGFLFSSEERRKNDERLRNSIRMPNEFIVLFAVKENEENDDVKWYVIDKRTGRAYVFTESKYALTDFGTVRMLACSKYARCFMVDEMKKRSFWADFSEDNWWRKLKVKFDKTQSIDILQNKDESNSDGTLAGYNIPKDEKRIYSPKSEETTHDYRKIGLLREAIIDKVRQKKIECYLLKMLIGEDAAKCFPEFEKVISTDIILDLKKRMRLARVTYDGGRRVNTVVLRADAFYALTQKCDKMNEYAFMKLESDWELLFDTRFQDEIARNHESEYESEAAGAVQKTTFVCKECKKEKEIKFLHKDETCADCYNLKETDVRKPVLRSLKDPASSKDESNAGSGTKLYLGTFSFTEEDNKRIRAACAKYLPSDTNTVEAQLRLQKSLEYVMNTAILEMKTELIWKVNEGATEEEKTRHFKTALVNTIMTVEELLEVLSTELLKRKVDQATSEELLKAWVTLEYYSYIIKPQYSMNIRHYRDYIHSVVKAKFDYPDQEGWGSPVRFEGTHICFDSKELIKWRNTHVLSPQYELHGALPLMMKEPVVTLFEDGTKTKEYILGTEGDEDFSGKYFLVSVRVSSHGDPAAFAVQIDGFISDTPEDRNITLKDIGYRFEVHFLACSAEASKERYKMLRGRDLDMKALKYQGYTTPTNVRLVGVCPECGKSFAFRGYAFYMAQDDVVYSDDGVDVCTVSAYDIDKDKVYEVEGKKFRYYNSFNCPNCLTPYIDYKKYPEMKKFGVSGCVHLGRKYYKASEDQTCAECYKETGASSVKPPLPSKKVDIVAAENPEQSAESPESANKTFVCKVCQKQKEIKFLYKDQTCADCYKGKAVSSVKPHLPSTRVDLKQKTGDSAIQHTIKKEELVFCFTHQSLLLERYRKHIYQHSVTGEYFCRRESIEAIPVSPYEIRERTIEYSEFMPISREKVTLLALEVCRWLESLSYSNDEYKRQAGVCRRIIEENKRISD